jgi:hypothetical protein
MSRFISGGTISEGNDNDNTTSEPTKNASTTSANDEAWLKAQAAIDATRQRKPGSGLGSAGGPGSGVQEGGKSLYETLQANKG